MTPGESIRKHCKECVGSPYEIKNCKGDYLYATERRMSFLQIQIREGAAVCKIDQEILYFLHEWFLCGY